MKKHSNINKIFKVVFFHVVKMKTLRKRVFSFCKYEKRFEIFSFISTLNFLKGHKPSLNTKMKISKKVCTVSGNGTNVFYSSHQDLSGGKKFSQHMLTFCCLNDHLGRKCH